MRPTSGIRLALTVGIALAGGGAAASAGWFGEPPAPHCTLPASTATIRCPEQQTLDELGAAQVSWALEVHRFDRLEIDFGRWCVSGERQRDGQWMLVAFGRGVQRVHRHAPAQWPEIMKAWRQAYPDSTAVRLADAIGILHDVRVDRDPLGRALTPEGQQLDHQAGSKAWTLLEPLIEGAGPGCPAVDDAALQALQMMQAGPQAVRPVYRRAVHRAPTYVALRQTMAGHEFRWSGGSVAVLDQFIDAADRQMQDAGEAGLFARLHGHRTLKRLVDAARIAPKESAAVAQAAVAHHWARLAASYDALTARWPESHAIRSMFAGAACLARDADRYHALRDDLLAYRRWLAFAEPVDVCDLRLGYLPPELRPARASD